MNPLYAETLFNFLYGKVDGYHISTSSRRHLDPASDKFLYGEIPFKTWHKIVEQINPKEDAVFFDLGSGTGRVVMQSYLAFNFCKSIGVEFIEGLHNKALETKNTFEKIINPQIIKHTNSRELQFIRGDIFAIDLSEADFILLNYPLKGEENFLRLEEKFLQELKPKTKIVTTIRALKNKAFKPCGVKNHDFSWGESTAYLYEVNR